MTSRWRSRSVTWGKRLVLVILIMCGIVYGVLSFAERSVEPIRLGLQDYLTKVSGHRGEVTEMVTVKLMPDVVFRMKGILIRHKTDDKTMLKAEQAYIAVPFINLIFGIRSYLGFEVNGLETASGFFLPQKLVLDFAGITDPSGGEKAPQFLAEGRYNGKNLLLTAEMIRKNRGKKPPVYKFDDSFRLTGKLGLMEGEGVFVREFTGIGVEDVTLHRDGDEAVFDVTDIERQPARAKLEGTINAIPFRAELSGSKITLVPGSQKPEDLKTLARVIADVVKDLGIYGKPDILAIEITAPAETEEKK